MTSVKRLTGLAALEIGMLQLQEGCVSSPASAHPRASAGP